MTISTLIATATAVASLNAPPIFRFETDELWLNLHHFLYVLGRAEAKTSDAGRRAVVDAPNDAGRGVEKLTEDDRRVWREAVRFYADGPSRKDAIFDAPLPAVAHALIRARDDSTLTDTTLDQAWLTTLRRAAQVYRKAWWPAHRAANRARAAAIQSLVEGHGDSVLAFIGRVYGMQWPQSGFAVHLSAYANWAGAYSTDGNLLVMSSLDEETKGLHGLETVFHEGMHQWDDAVFQLLREQARAAGRLVPNGLSHAMIFYTAGEAVRRVVPGYTPYAEVAGVWNRDSGRFRAALISAWQPHLDGRTTLADALGELIRQTGVKR
jgi:hypothetical protein